MHDVQIPVQSIARFAPIIGQERVDAITAVAEEMRARLAGRVVWNVNSTATGGGVAEMLSALLPYTRGAGLDSRWLVLQGNPTFFHVTKRLHHALHGSPGDGSSLGEDSREIYEEVMRSNASEIAALVRPRDIVMLHDPQTAGLAPRLLDGGAVVVWRCHIGHDEPSAEVERAWRFLEPYLRDIPAMVFSREAYVPDYCDHGRTSVITPSIDAFSPKNQELDPATVRAILVRTGLIEGPNGDTAAVFRREDGSPGRVDREADVIRHGRAPSADVPLIVQVSRWDPLKDPRGVMRGFAELVEGGGGGDAELVLAGPNVHAVADDPEGATELDAVIEAWRALPHALRGRVHIASLPMADPQENAAIVNALQRHATVAVQKSLHEGFGLTVTEAMWKARPVVASAVGGIQDQIEDGREGLLLHDPRDGAAFAAALRDLLADPGYAQGLGQRARERVRRDFLGPTHLTKYARLFARLDVAYEAAGQPERFIC